MFQIRKPWLGELITSLKTAYYNQYGRNLYVSDAELSKFVNEKGFTSHDGAIAHFKRVISYYADKFSILPTFKHLTSPKIPTLLDIPEFEKALYAEYPDFTPILVSPSENKLSSETRGFSGLFTSASVVELFLDFASAINKEDDLFYCEQALIVIERLIFSMAYRKSNTKVDFLEAIDAHKKLASLRRSVEKIEGGHWSRIFYPDQELELFGVKLHFWEVPKVIINHSVASTLFNISKYGNAHAHAALGAMHEYADGRYRYLRFLLVLRDELRLTPHEEVHWENFSNSTFGKYPYSHIESV